jgi:hypothetical protein
VLTGALLAVFFAAAHAAAQTAAVAPAADIRDIRGPKPIPSVWTLPLLLTAGALVVLGAYAAWRWSRRRRFGAVKSPFEIALQRIEGVRALMRPDNGRAFSIEVSDAVREYIEGRFQVMAAHRTTNEFLYDLLASADALLAEHRTSLAEFLNLCDLAKFAGWHLSLQDMQTMQHSARAFVLETGRGGTAAKAAAVPAVTRSAAAKGTYGSLPST